MDKKTIYMKYYDICIHTSITSIVLCNVYPNYWSEVQDCIFFHHSIAMCHAFLNMDMLKDSQNKLQLLSTVVDVGFFNFVDCQQWKCLPIPALVETDFAYAIFRDWWWCHQLWRGRVLFLDDLVIFCPNLYDTLSIFTVFFSFLDPASDPNCFPGQHLGVWF